MTKTMFEKLKEMHEEWIQFKANMDAIVSKTEEALDNANKTMDGIYDTLDTIQNTLEHYDKVIIVLTNDYNNLKKTVNEHVKKKLNRLWWMPWR